MKILVTAFEPFGSDAENPTERILAALPESIEGITVSKLLLPVVFGESLLKTVHEIERTKPDAVISLGLAGGRSAVTVERVAINLVDARIPDNYGIAPHDLPIFDDGDAAHFATLPTRKMVDAIKERGIAAELSYTAGTYVCNQLMYGVLHYIKKNSLPIMAGFIHVPYSAEMGVANKPSMPTDMMTKAIEAAIGTLK